MLVLSRKVNETIVFEVNGITFTQKFIEMRDGKIRLAFDAPENVGIYRQEVWEKVLAQRLAANCTQQDE